MQTPHKENADFEAWATKEGLPLSQAHDGVSANGWFPATYWDTGTECAWRAWANKPQVLPDTKTPEKLMIELPPAWAISEDHPYKTLTERKTAWIIQNNDFKISGYILNNGNRMCLSYGSAVRWLSAQDLYRIMHAMDNGKEPVAIVKKTHMDERDWQSIDPIGTVLDGLENGTPLFLDSNKDSAKELADAKKEILALHTKLAGETLRADQGWERYEARNLAVLNLEKQFDLAIDVQRKKG